MKLFLPDLAASSSSSVRSTERFHAGGSAVRKYPQKKSTSLEAKNIGKNVSAPLSLLFEAEQRYLKERALNPLAPENIAPPVENNAPLPEQIVTAVVEDPISITTADLGYDAGAIPCSQLEPAEENLPRLRRSSRQKKLSHECSSNDEVEEEEDIIVPGGRVRTSLPSAVSTEVHDEKLDGISPNEFRSLLSGVYFHLPKKEWRAVIGRGNRRQQKTFSVRKYGFFAAKKQAEYFRTQFDLTGYVFDTRRGAAVSSPCPKGRGEKRSRELVAVEEKWDDSLVEDLEGVVDDVEDTIMETSRSPPPPLTRPKRLRYVSPPRKYPPPLVVQLIDYEEVSPPVLVVKQSIEEPKPETNHQALLELYIELKQRMAREIAAEQEATRAIERMNASAPPKILRIRSTKQPPAKAPGTAEPLRDADLKLKDPEIQPKQLEKAKLEEVLPLKQEDLLPSPPVVVPKPCLTAEELGAIELIAKPPEPELLRPTPEKAQAFQLAFQSIVATAMRELGKPMQDNAEKLCDLAS